MVCHTFLRIASQPSISRSMKCLEDSGNCGSESLRSNAHTAPRILQVYSTIDTMMDMGFNTWLVTATPLPPLEHGLSHGLTAIFIAPQPT